MILFHIDDTVSDLGAMPFARRFYVSQVNHPASWAIFFDEIDRFKFRIPDPENIKLRKHPGLFRQFSFSAGVLKKPAISTLLYPIAATLPSVSKKTLPVSSLTEYNCNAILSVKLMSFHPVELP